jgi:hypothetical protein
MARKSGGGGYRLPKGFGYEAEIPSTIKPKKESILFKVLDFLGFIKDQNNHSQHIIDWENRPRDKPKVDVISYDQWAVDDEFSMTPTTDEQRNRAAYGARRSSNGGDNVWNGTSVWGSS